MARTIRRKNFVPDWVTHEWRWDSESYTRMSKVPREGKDLQRSLHKYHGDAGCSNRWCCAGPGPWWWNVYQRSHRREVKEQLRKFSLNPEFEVQALSKPRTDYWD